MIRALDAGAERFLADLTRLQRRIDRVQREITSGRRVAWASDDPERAGELLAAQARLDRAVQIRMNLGRAKSETEVADQAIQQAVHVMERVLQLGVQGGSTPLDAGTRATIAAQLDPLLGQLVTIAASTAEGRFIFSGDADQAAPYTLDPTQPNGVSAYAGSASTREVLHPSGSRFEVARTAQQIFEGSMAAVNALRAAVLAGDRAALDAAMAAGHAAQARLNSELGFYGIVENQIDEAINFAHKLEIREQNNLSVLRDTDLVAAALELDQARIQQEAALTARARLPRGTLFDFLG